MSNAKPPAHQQIMQLLQTHPWITVNEMVEILVNRRSTSTDAAVRCAARRLLKDRSIIRQREGASYQFALAGDAPVIVHLKAGEGARLAAAAGLKLSPMEWTAVQLEATAC